VYVSRNTFGLPRFGPPTGLGAGMEYIIPRSCSWQVTSMRSVFEKKSRTMVALTVLTAVAATHFPFYPLFAESWR
jgi:hypothetical protein